MHPFQGPKGLLNLEELLQVALDLTQDSMIIGQTALPAHSEDPHTELSLGKRKVRVHHHVGFTFLDTQHTIRVQIENSLSTARRTSEKYIWKNQLT